MHEFSVMSSIIDTVDAYARANQAKRVVSINLVVGEQAGFIDDSLLFYFDMLTPGTLCAGALLVIRRTPLRFHCRGCDRVYVPAGEHFRCPMCGMIGQLTSDGADLLIECMEIET